jgi:nicotinamidase-related amidase
MPITTIDPVVALLVIDLQAGFTGAAAVDPVSEIAARAGQLANTSLTAAYPLCSSTSLVAPQDAPTTAASAAVHSRTAGPTCYPNWTPQVRPHHFEGALGAFHDTGLYEHLTGRCVTQVVIVGIATSVGVESTARTSRGSR